MALISLEKLEVTLDILYQIRDAIKNLIDIDIISQVINDDLLPLLDATDYFIAYCFSKID